MAATVALANMSYLPPFAAKVMHEIVQRSVGLRRLTALLLHRSLDEGCELVKHPRVDALVGIYSMRSLRRECCV
jgi:hypothetical protein